MEYRKSGVLEISALAAYSLTWSARAKSGKRYAAEHRIALYSDS
jgi:hypothetical protein